MLLLLAGALAAPLAAPKLEVPPPSYTLDASGSCLPSGLGLQVVRRPESGGPRVSGFRSAAIAIMED